MEIKDKWTDADFDIMGWHDSRLYQIKFPDENYNFTLFLDYIFKWEKQNDETFKFLVSPCELKFENISNFKMSLSFENFLEIFIVEIRREKLGLTPNKKMMEWKYIIETDRGDIEFESTGFKMNLISQPILSDYQSLNS
ncbi:hypothetical protein J8L88_14630 [Aquimarina sp. MMG015]|uniref:hypothetical protein n=1 Tax=Aquimarina sp. MMG015 TaxID=2822689 RepID=UPI001B39D106|nr:hypothetical protein [Aquimarina sp. MMG015]MBQ4804095.1 hypothetical protein [Aquimarina sp. MMG015]